MCCNCATALSVCKDNFGGSLGVDMYICVCWVAGLKHLPYIFGFLFAAESMKGGCLLTTAAITYFAISLLIQNKYIIEIPTIYR